jgi:hypothetical protein
MTESKSIIDNTIDEKIKFLGSELQTAAENFIEYKNKRWYNKLFGKQQKIKENAAFNIEEFYNKNPESDLNSNDNYRKELKKQFGFDDNQLQMLEYFCILKRLKKNNRKISEDLMAGIEIARSINQIKSADPKYFNQYPESLMEYKASLTMASLSAGKNQNNIDRINDEFRTSYLEHKSQKENKYTDSDVFKHVGRGLLVLGVAGGLMSWTVIGAIAGAVFCAFGSAMIYKAKRDVEKLKESQESKTRFNDVFAKVGQNLQNAICKSSVGKDVKPPEQIKQLQVANSNYLELMTQVTKL